MNIHHSIVIELKEVNGPKVGSLFYCFERKVNDVHDFHNMCYTSFVRNIIISERWEKWECWVVNTICVGDNVKISCPEYRNRNRLCRCFPYLELELNNRILMWFYWYSLLRSITVNWYITKSFPKLRMILCNIWSGLVQAVYF